MPRNEGSVLAFFHDHKSDGTLPASHIAHEVADKLTGYWQRATQDNQEEYLNKAQQAWEATMQLCFLRRSELIKTQHRLMTPREQRYPETVRAMYLINLQIGDVDDRIHALQRRLPQPMVVRPYNQKGRKGYAIQADPFMAAAIGIRQRQVSSNLMPIRLVNARRSRARTTPGTQYTPNYNFY